MTVKEFYEQLGQEYMEVYERMTGSEALIRRFLKQFCEDGTFLALEKAVAEGDAKQIFLEAHTLKGLSANLGLKPLCEKTGVLVELTRSSGNTGYIGTEDIIEDGRNTALNRETVDDERIQEAFAKIREIYQEIIERIQMIE